MWPAARRHPKQDTCRPVLVELGWAARPRERLFERRSLHHWINDGTARAPSFREAALMIQPFEGVGAGQGSAPAFADLNGDGLVDALVGSASGGVLQLLNVGTATEPAFTPVHPTPPHPSISSMIGVTPSGYSAPSFVGTDGTGRPLGLLIGAADGTVRYFESGRTGPGATGGSKGGSTGGYVTISVPAALQGTFGSTISIAAGPSATVGDVKAALAGALGVSASSLSLSAGGCPLDDGASLSSALLSSAGAANGDDAIDAVFSGVAPSDPFVVTLPLPPSLQETHGGASLTLATSADASVGSLKALIEAVTGLDASEQEISFGGSVLVSDSQTLGAAGIVSGATAYLTKRSGNGGGEGGGSEPPPSNEYVTFGAVGVPSSAPPEDELLLADPLGAVHASVGTRTTPIVYDLDGDGDGDLCVPCFPDHCPACLLCRLPY